MDSTTLHTLEAHAREEYESGDVKTAVDTMWRILAVRPNSPISGLGFRIARETADFKLADEVRRQLEMYGTFNDHAVLEWIVAHLSLGTGSPLEIEIQRLLTGPRSAGWISHVTTSLQRFSVVIRDDLSVVMPTSAQRNGDGSPPDLRDSSDDSLMLRRLHDLIEAELREGAHRRNYFLVRLLERLSTDKEIARNLCSDGLPVRLLNLAVDQAASSLKTRWGYGFAADLRWAVVRTRRSRITSLWIADEGTPTARLVTRELQRTASRRRKRSTDSRDAFSVGEIRWVQLHESHRGRRSELHHPAVIVEKAGANKWRVISLTTDVEGNPDGRRVPRPTEQGLPYAGYVWHEVQKVFVAQIGDHIGWVHPELVAVIGRSVKMRTVLFDALSDVANEKHPEAA